MAICRGGALTATSVVSARNVMLIGGSMKGEGRMAPITTAVRMSKALIGMLRTPASMNTGTVG